MQPDLAKIKEGVKSNKDLIDKISGKITDIIPGFKGYTEKDDHYTTDQIIRDFIADKILLIKKDVERISSDFSRESKFDNLKDLELILTNLEGLFKKTKYAEGIPTKMKVTEDDMSRIVEYDWRLIADLDAFDELVPKLRDGEDFKTEFNAVRDKIFDFEKAFNERKNVIMEVI